MICPLFLFSLQCLPAVTDTRPQPLPRSRPLRCQTPWGGGGGEGDAAAERRGQQPGCGQVGCRGGRADAESCTDATGKAGVGVKCAPCRSGGEPLAVQKLRSCRASVHTVRRYGSPPYKAQLPAYCRHSRRHVNTVCWREWRCESYLSKVGSHATMCLHARVKCVQNNWSNMMFEGREKPSGALL